MPLVAWPHCSCPPDPVRDPSYRKPAGYPPEPPSEGPGKVTIQFSASKARVEIARRIGRPLRERPSHRLMQLLSPTELSKNHTDSAPDRSAPVGLSRPGASRPWPGTSPSPSVAITGDVAIDRRCLVVAAGDAASTRTAIVFSCGDDGDRTRDLLVANQALSQLSYVPSSPADSRSQWAHVDSNHGPQLYQSCALAN